MTCIRHVRTRVSDMCVPYPSHWPRSAALPCLLEVSISIACVSTRVLACVIEMCIDMHLRAVELDRLRQTCAELELRVQDLEKQNQALVRLAMLYIGVADGVSIARVGACRYSK